MAKSNSRRNLFLDSEPDSTQNVKQEPTPSENNRRRNLFADKSTNPDDYPNKTSTIMNQWDKKPTSEKEIDENTSKVEVLKTALSNMPSSSFRLIRDVVNSALNPIDTAKGVYDVAAGGVEKLIPGGEDKHVPAIDAVIDHMKNRYTTTAGFKKALALDPVGVLSDLTMVVMPAGGALKQAGKLGKYGKLAEEAGEMSKLSKAGDMITKTGAFLDPATVPGKAGSALIKRGNKGPYPGYVTKSTDLIKKGIEKIPGGSLATGAIQGILDARDPRKIMENNLKMKGISPEQTKKMIDLTMEKGLGGPLTNNNKILDKLIEAEKAKKQELIEKADKRQEVVNESRKDLIDKALKNPEDYKDIKVKFPENLIDPKDFKQFIPENTIDTQFGKNTEMQKQIVDDFMKNKGYTRGKMTANETNVLSENLAEQFKDVKEGQLRGKDADPVEVNTLDSLRRGVDQALIQGVDKILPQLPGLKNVSQNMDEFIALKNALYEATTMMPEDVKRSAISIAKNTALGGPKVGMVEIMKSLFQTPKVKVAYAAVLNKLEKTGKSLYPVQQNIGQALVIPERAKDLDNIQPDIGEN